MLLKYSVITVFIMGIFTILFDLYNSDKVFNFVEVRKLSDTSAQAYNLARYHSISLAYWRDNTSHVGVIPSDNSGILPYLTEDYTPFRSWQSTILASGCLITYLESATADAEQKLLAQFLYEVTENPRAGLVTSTGIQNSNFSLALTTGQTEGTAVIASCNGA